MQHKFNRLINYFFRQDCTAVAEEAVRAQHLQRPARLQQRERYLRRRLASLQIQQQSLLARAAELSVQVQELEQQAPRAVSESPQAARQLSQRLTSLDSQLTAVHHQAQQAEARMQLLLQVLARLQHRLAWHGSRKHPVRPAGSLQRSISLGQDQ